MSVYVESICRASPLPPSVSPLLPYAANGIGAGTRFVIPIRLHFVGGRVKLIVCRGGPVVSKITVESEPGIHLADTSRRVPTSARASKHHSAIECAAPHRIGVGAVPEAVVQTESVPCAAQVGTAPRHPPARRAGIEKGLYPVLPENAVLRRSPIVNRPCEIEGGALFPIS